MKTITNWAGFGGTVLTTLFALVGSVGAQDGEPAAGAVSAAPTAGDWIHAAERGFHSAIERITEFAPNVIGAIAILFFGWLAAKTVAFVVRRRMQRVKLRKELEGDEVARWQEVSQLSGRLAYGLVMLFVAMGCFWALQLNVVTEPISRLFQQMFAYVPQMIGAAFILLAAWVAGLFARTVATKLVRAARLDERLGRRLAKTEGERDSVVEEISFLRSEHVGQVAFWIILSIGVTGALNALQLEAVMAPLQEMLTGFLKFVPNLAAAGAILLVGVVLARMGRGIVRGLLHSAGLDGWVKQRGLERSWRGRDASQMVAQLLYILLIIPVVIASLGALQIHAVSDPSVAMLQTALGAIPMVFAAVITVVTAYLVSRILGDFAEHALAGIGFDNLPARLGFHGKAVDELKFPPSQATGRLVAIGVMAFACMEASKLLGFGAVAALLSEFISFGGNVLLGLVIVGGGLFVARLASDLTRSSFGEDRGGLLGRVAYTAVVVAAVSLALPRLGAPVEILAVIVGVPLLGVAAGAAVAFGIGGREIAARRLEQWLGDGRRGDKETKTHPVVPNKQHAG